MRVENFKNNQGRAVPNQFILHGEKGRYFQSYDSIIAFIPYDYNQKTQLGRYWDYSRTTGKYRNQFLDETKAETERKIKSGEYELNYEL